MFDGPLTAELDPGERRARLRLARSARIGPVTFHEALAHFGSAQRRLRAAGTISRCRHRARGRGAREGSAAASWCSAMPTYPPALAALPDAPPVLSAIGDLGLLAGPTLAVVGAREASLAGRRFAGELAGALGAAGFVVASGLARGIDAAAHQAALPTGTVAVLAGGIDQVYPPQNAGPAARHRRARPAAGRDRRSARRRSPAPFPAATASSAACRQGVVVIEAADRSGSLITAHRAARAGPRSLRRPGLADGPALCRIQ